MRTIRPQLACPTCGYELAKLPSGRCPECGAEFIRAELIRRSRDLGISDRSLGLALITSIAVPWAAGCGMLVAYALAWTRVGGPPPIGDIQGLEGLLVVVSLYALFYITPLTMLSTAFLAVWVFIRWRTRGRSVRGAKLSIFGLFLWFGGVWFALGAGPRWWWVD